MPKQHTYVLGLNTYDHDVSACLLRDGAVAFAIAKEDHAQTHASGFYVNLIVRNCYILPVPEMEERLVYQGRPGLLPEHQRAEAARPA